MQRGCISRLGRFSKGILWRSFVKQKTIETLSFVALNNKVTKAWHLPLVVYSDASFIIHIHLVMVISYCCFISAKKALNRPDSNLFWPDTDFFFVRFVSLLLWKKNCAVKAAKVVVYVRVASKSTFASNDTAWKIEFFAYVISRKWRAN